MRLNSETFKLFTAMILSELCQACMRGHLFPQVIMMQYVFSSLCLACDLTRTRSFFFLFDNVSCEGTLSL